MRHTKYPSLTNHHVSEAIAAMRAKGEFKEDRLWVASEKIHGTNFQMGVDLKGTMKFGRRKDWIGPDETFYGYRPHLEQFQKWLTEIHKNLLNGYFNQGPRPVVAVTLFGEFFGAGVLQGIDYGPTKRFALFDVLLEFGDAGLVPCDEGSGHADIRLPSREWMPFTGMMSLAIAINIPCPPIICMGTFQQCMDEDGSQYSKIHPEGNSRMEGLVIRPAHGDIFYKNKRFIIKKKNPVFADKAHKKKVHKDVQVDISPELQAFVDNLLVFATPAHLGSLQSNSSEEDWSFKNWKNLLYELKKDVLDDYHMENPPIGQMLSVDTPYALACLNSRCAEMLREELKKVG